MHIKRGLMCIGLFYSHYCGYISAQTDSYGDTYKNEIVNDCIWWNGISITEIVFFRGIQVYKESRVSRVHRYEES